MSVQEVGNATSAPHTHISFAYLSESLFCVIYVYALVRYLPSLVQVSM